MNQHKIFLFMERFWLGLAVVTLLFGGWLASQGKWEQAKFPFFCTFCAMIVYGLRRYQRKRLESNNKP
ncbi:MAG: hypothetical protein K1X77_04465 [Bacteroidia bacterium]|jgi:hypothetical protein|nr:hypothetical protein [Bacteroidia bacterium]